MTTLIGFSVAGNCGKATLALRQLDQHDIRELV